MKFILELMKIKFQLPIKDQIDNKGDMFISHHPNFKRNKSIYTTSLVNTSRTTSLKYSLLILKKSDLITKNFG